MVLLPGLVLLSPGTHPVLTLAAQCVVVAHSGGALARVLTDTSVRLTALGFWLFTYVWLGLAPLAMLATDTYPEGYRTGAATAFTATALTELGLVAYSAGAALARRAAGRSVVLEPLLSRRIAPVRALLLCGLSLVLAILLIPRAGGPGVFFSSRQALEQAGADGEMSKALEVSILAAPAFWALVALLHLPRPRAGDRLLRAVRLLLLPLFLGLNAVVNNPISRPRFWVGTVLLVLLFSWRRFSRPRAFRLAAAALAAVVLLVFPYSDYFRTDKREAIQVLSPAEQFTTNMDYDAFQQMLVGVDYVKEAGFSPSAVLGPALFMVPRSAWPGKPEPVATTLAEYAGYRFQNLSAPLWIESYLWGGAPAVVAVFCLLGAAGRRMDDIRERLRGRRATLAVLLVPAFAFYQMIFLRGSLLAVMAPMTLFLALPLVISSSAARSSRSPSPACPPADADHVPIPAQGGFRAQPHRLR
ncbi:hypothetical protein [Streptomyces carpinensis]|uniref:Oligosaccharide repeat unit polymerase n=1 Tax=Streptomyces carpinensis TaxID=66369 RepID=A0ABV1WCU1_9ACTN|nr:hypothetical protein [Streptomyces carpinensis]